MVRQFVFFGKAGKFQFLNYLSTHTRLRKFNFGVEKWLMTRALALLRLAALNEAHLSFQVR